MVVPYGVAHRRQLKLHAIVSSGNITRGAHVAAGSGVAIFSMNLPELAVPQLGERSHPQKIPNGMRSRLHALLKSSYASKSTTVWRINVACCPCALAPFTWMRCARKVMGGATGRIHVNAAIDIGDVGVL